MDCVPLPRVYPGNDATCIFPPRKNEVQTKLLLFFFFFGGGGWGWYFQS